MARSQLLEPDLAEYLVHHPDRGLRETLVANKRLDADLITVPAQDDDPQARVTVATDIQIGPTGWKLLPPSVA
ncbi:hypothetical protein OIE62_39470 [Streptomyces scopuliridis]|uniref:Uncharacterized protein n=1 Tax=Streptomyces scopuliridis TaxID=452529 RepID=A0ACD4ZCF6_9ACTN|nr:hypothetical protein [Streptomyces scopuliridis]WSB31574.1 hypothetical protein OG949_00865 [Streptomyces scopuliridis]WSB95820.1 hypothetical protein OG835_01455 [Streptomyces scopuliridis]WSC10473.1 hypothetical protein OIE62_39470 [Streptomyces scopuliridis]